MMDHLTMVMPYYMNPGMLARQYELWTSYPDELKARIDVVIVDDGSPEHHAIDVSRSSGLPGLTIYRVQVDIPWNQHGARNLGAKQARGPWLFMTDMDHMLPTESLRRLLAYDDGQRVVTFARVDAPDMLPTVRPDGTRKPHPNTFAVTKRDYWKVGGYDEAYCGIYGTDSVFTNRLFALGVDHREDMPIIRVPREVVPDASTTTLLRKEGRPHNASAMIKAKKKAMGMEHTNLTLNFSWERVW